MENIQYVSYRVGQERIRWLIVPYVSACIVSACSVVLGYLCVCLRLLGIRNYRLTSTVSGRKAEAVLDSKRSGYSEQRIWIGASRKVSLKDLWATRPCSMADDQPQLSFSRSLSMYSLPWITPDSRSSLLTACTGAAYSTIR